MTPQKLHTTPGPVLDEKGSPNAGYATKSVLQYSRKAIKAAPWRIKEWDWYQVSNGEKCLQFTLGHAAYAGQVGVMFFDFKTGEMLVDENKILVCPFGSLHLEENAEEEGTTAYSKDGMEMAFIHKDGKRRLICRCNGFSADVTLEPQTPHAMVINIPFAERETAFYYNHKINCMKAEGTVTYGGSSYTFNKNDSYGLLDWGRGVWPFHNEWYWSNGAGKIDGEVFGFNLGCGFGVSDAATENILFYKQETHKLGKVSFTLTGDYDQPWHLTDEDGRLDLWFTPQYDRKTAIKLIWVDNCTHQMFGSFKGTAKLDDGTILQIDNIISFAEHAVNNW
ncbi:MAG: DUF2804 domain-containing protein [Oscillospiraceae bacterium]|nr:DUF2804 domain-containing protein [Oscillospiraceae bacterium]